MAFAAKRKHEYTAAEHIEALRALHFSSADLLALIDLLKELTGEELERRLQELKNSADGKSQPLEFLRRMLIGGQCNCAATARLCQGDTK
jgi:hypothetical protein